MELLRTLHGFSIGSSMGFFLMALITTVAGKEDAAFVCWSLAMFWLGFFLTASFLLKRGGDR